MAQVQKKFTDDQVKELIGKCLRKEVGRTYLQEILEINKTRFFALGRHIGTVPFNSRSHISAEVRPERYPRQSESIS